MHWTNPKRRDGQAGFTMVELLVVLLIIGILAAIAIPTLLSQRGKATDAAAKSEASTAARAMAIYEEDHGTYACGDSAACRTALRSIESTVGDGSVSFTASGGATGDPTGTGYRVTAVGAQLRSFWIDRAPGAPAAQNGCDLNGAQLHGECRVTGGATSGHW